jgi:hypothetical protein
VSKHRARRNWMPLVAGSVVLAVTGGIIVGFTIATGGSPSLASHPRTRPTDLAAGEPRHAVLSSDWTAASCSSAATAAATRWLGKLNQTAT